MVGVLKFFLWIYQKTRGRLFSGPKSTEKICFALQHVFYTFEIRERINKRFCWQLRAAAVSSPKDVSFEKLELDNEIDYDFHVPFFLLLWKNHNNQVPVRKWAVGPKGPSQGDRKYLERELSRPAAAALMRMFREDNYNHNYNLRQLWFFFSESIF